MSITATVLSIAIGTPLAYLFTIFKIKGKSVLNILIVVASMSAPFIGAYSWILLLGRSGVITTFLKNLGIAIPEIYGFGGIVLVMTLQLFPLVFLYAKGALKNIDNSLIEAAENLGCSGIVCFFKVVVPLIMPTLLAAALLVFMRGATAPSRWRSTQRLLHRRPPAVTTVLPAAILGDRHRHHHRGVPGAEVVLQ